MFVRIIQTNYWHSYTVGEHMRWMALVDLDCAATNRPRKQKTNQLAQVQSLQGLRRELDKVGEECNAWHGHYRACPWGCALPTVLIFYKDGTIRFCIDYRKLSARKIWDLYPIPYMDECVHWLWDEMILSILELIEDIWKERLPSKNDQKLPSRFIMAYLTSLACPFGTRKATATFHQAREVLLTRVKLQFGFVYLDDTVIFCIHEKAISIMFGKLWRYQTTQRWHWTWRNNNILHIASIISALSFALRASRIPQEWLTPYTVWIEHPTNLTDRQSLLRLCSVSRCFV